jgi:hypothetical protein
MNEKDIEDVLAINWQIIEKKMSGCDQAEIDSMRELLTEKITKLSNEDHSSILPPEPSKRAPSKLANFKYPSQ